MSTKSRGAEAPPAMSSECNDRRANRSKHDAGTIHPNERQVSIVKYSDVTEADGAAKPDIVQARTKLGSRIESSANQITKFGRQREKERKCYRGDAVNERNDERRERQAARSSFARIC